MANFAKQVTNGVQPLGGVDGVHAGRGMYAPPS